MIGFDYRIPYEYGDVIRLKPVFDIHMGNTTCDIAALRRYLADSDEHTYFLGGGDLMDSIIIPDKRYTKHCDATDTDEIVDEQIRLIRKELAPYKEHFIGSVIGNHERTIHRHCGTNPMRRLCETLLTK